jgi:hypothetical protein
MSAIHRAVDCMADVYELLGELVAASINSTGKTSRARGKLQFGLSDSLLARIIWAREDIMGVFADIADESQRLSQELESFRAFKPTTPSP